MTQEIFRRLLTLHHFDMARDLALRFASELSDDSMDVVTLGEVQEHLRRVSSNELLWCDQQQRQDGWAFCETHFQQYKLPLPKRAAFFLSLARSFTRTDTTGTTDNKEQLHIFTRGQPASAAISELDILRVLELALKALRGAKAKAIEAGQTAADETERMSRLINLVSSVVILLQELQVLHLSGQRPRSAKVVAFLPSIPSFNHMSSLGKTSRHPPGRELHVICHDAIRSLCERGNDKDAIVLAKAFGVDAFILQIVDFQTAVAMAASSLSSSSPANKATMTIPISTTSTSNSTALLPGRANTLESLLRSKGINHLCELFLASGHSDIDLTYESFESDSDNFAQSTKVVWNHASTNATVAEQFLQFFLDPARPRGDELVDTTPTEEEWMQDVRLARGLCERIYSDWRSAKLLGLPLKDLVEHNPKYFLTLLQHCIDATHADNRGRRPGRALHAPSETACVLFLRTHTRKPAGWTARALVKAVLGVLIPNTVGGSHPLWSRAQIEHFVALCHQPDDVGLLLLQALRQTQITTRVEVVIFAHHCFAQSVGEVTATLFEGGDNESSGRSSSRSGDDASGNDIVAGDEDKESNGSARVLQHMLALVHECVQTGRLGLLARLLLCAADHTNIEHIVSRLDTPQSLATVLCSEPSHSNQPEVWDIQAVALKRVLANYLRGQCVRDLDTATRVFVQLGMCRALADTLFETAETRLTTLATQLKAITHEGHLILQQDISRFHELWEDLLTVLQVCMSLVDSLFSFHTRKHTHTHTHTRACRCVCRPRNILRRTTRCSGRRRAGACVPSSSCKCGCCKTRLRATAWW